MTAKIWYDALIDIVLGSCPICGEDLVKEIETGIVFCEECGYVKG